MQSRFEAENSELLILVCISVCINKLMLFIFCPEVFLHLFINYNLFKVFYMYKIATCETWQFFFPLISPFFFFFFSFSYIMTLFLVFPKTVFVKIVDIFISLMENLSKFHQLNIKLDIFYSYSFQLKYFFNYS